MRQEMRDYLDAPVDRHGTNCEKWDLLGKHYGRDDLIAMWVADMDFRTVPQVREALVKRAEHAIYGYTDDSEAEHEAEMGWLERRHGLKVESDWILYSPGVVDSLFFCVDALTKPEDAILIQPPVYGPFYQAVKLYGRRLVESPLIYGPSGWRMDYDDLEQKFSSGVRMMILCSPHNPVGRVWTRDELQKLVDLALRYGVLIISDEIHADFTFDGHRQTRILALDGAQRCSVMLTSATNPSIWRASGSPASSRRMPRFARHSPMNSPGRTPPPRIYSARSPRRPPTAAATNGWTPSSSMSGKTGILPLAFCASACPKSDAPPRRAPT